ncbi:MAG: MBL fold metallo-hydrolase [Chloroflexota bacterium]
MKVRILGAHNCESEDSRMVSLLVDGVLALDAGGLTSQLSLEAQARLKAVLLTHWHYDHIRDIPALAMNLFLGGATLSLYTTASVRDALGANLLNGKLYPDFFARPAGRPVLTFFPVEPYQKWQIAGYEILAVPVNHAEATALGYQVSQEGKSVFYTGDTGSDLSSCWEHVSPQLLVMEVTMPNRYADSAKESHHLTPALLQEELVRFREMKGYLPRVAVVHMNPRLEGEIAGELDQVAHTLHNPVTLAHEGMELHL